MVAKVYFQNTALDTATLIDKLRKIPIRALLPLEEDASRYAIKPLAYSDRQRIESSLSAPAPACQAFTDSVSSGELNNYLGAKVAAPQTRQKHKGDHTKYGKKPVKPVTEEVKPGTEGVKPGTEGVKPGAAGMRPCIHPAKGF